jgi:hypothetical protein
VPYGTITRHDLGGVASTAVENTAVLINNAHIHGFVSTGGAAPQVGPDGAIGPFDTPDGEIVAARVATDFVANFPNITTTVDGTLITKLGVTLGVAGESTRWHTHSISLKGSETLTILGDVTLFLTAPHGETAIKLIGTSELIIPDGSRLTIYTAGDVFIGGNGLANANIQPSSFQIWGTDVHSAGQTIDLVGKGSLQAVIYAPNGDVFLNGDSDMMGSVVARDITLTGKAAFHYDSSLSNLNSHAPYGPGDWKLVTDPANKSSRAALLKGW